ncbi:MAG: hypothetical protein ACOX6H_03690 [Christensenellales bacterium]|jgi:hypothetical protein
MDFEKNLKNLYFAVKAETAHKVVVLRLIEDFGSSKVFIAFEIVNSMENGKEKFVEIKELKNEEVEKLISGEYLLKSMIGNSTWTYDPATKIGIKAEKNNIRITYNEPHKLHPENDGRFNASALQGFAGVNGIFDDARLLEFFAGKYKTKVERYNALLKTDRKAMLETMHSEKELILNKPKEGKAFVFDYYEEIIENPVNLKASLMHCKNKYKVNIELDNATKEELISVPFETKKLLVLSFVDLIEIKYSEESLNSIRDDAYALYPIILRLMKNLKYIDEKAFRFKNEYPLLKNVEIEKNEDENDNYLS